jgi:hypothetical protein
MPLENRISALTWAFLVSGSSLVLVDQAAQDRFSADLPPARVRCHQAGFCSDQDVRARAEEAGAAAS